MGMTIEKARLYKTAKATIACYGVAVGEVVSIANPERSNGKVWFDITSTEKMSAAEVKKKLGTLRYSEDHLTGFVL